MTIRLTARLIAGLSLTGVVAWTQTPASTLGFEVASIRLRQRPAGTPSSTRAPFSARP